MNAVLTLLPETVKSILCSLFSLPQILHCQIVNKKVRNYKENTKFDMNNFRLVKIIFLICFEKSLSVVRDFDL